MATQRKYLFEDATKIETPEFGLVFEIECLHAVRLNQGNAKSCEFRKKYRLIERKKMPGSP